MAQGPDCRSGILTGIDQIFSERADNSVTARVDVGDLFVLLARGFDNASGGGIDDGGDPAGLSVKGILCCHVSPLIIRILVFLRHTLTGMLSPWRLGLRGAIYAFG